MPSRLLPRQRSDLHLEPSHAPVRHAGPIAARPADPSMVTDGAQHARALHIDDQAVADHAAERLPGNRDDGNATSPAGEPAHCRACLGCGVMAETDLIRTPDQRLRVFVSSTLQELAAERQAVRDAVTRLRLAPVMFELGARPHPPQQLYRSYLAQSQVFVGVYWQSYGWVAPGEQVSGLEDEYLLSTGLPRLIYVKSPAPEREPRLAELLTRIRDDGDVSYQHFSASDELQRLVENDLAVLLSERFETASSGDSAAGDASLAGAVPVPATPIVGRDDDAAAVVDLVRAGGRASGDPYRPGRGREIQTRGRDRAAARSGL
jgi:hypothetical protein